MSTPQRVCLFRFVRPLLSGLLSLALALPSPALAMRQLTVEGAGLEELHRALNPSAAGLEEPDAAQPVPTVPGTDGANYERQAELARLRGETNIKQRAFEALATQFLEERLDLDRALNRMGRLITLGEQLLASDAGLFDRYVAEVVEPLLRYESRTLNLILASRFGDPLLDLDAYINQREKSQTHELVDRTIDRIQEEQSQWETARDFYYLPGLPVVVENAGFSHGERQRLVEAAQLVTSSEWLELAPRAFTRTESIDLLEQGVHPWLRLGATSMLGGRHFSVDISASSRLIALALIHEDTHLTFQDRLLNIEFFELSNHIPRTLRHRWIGYIPHIWPAMGRPSSVLNELQAYETTVRFLLHLWEHFGIGTVQQYSKEVQYATLFAADAKKALASLRRQKRLGHLDEDGQAWLSELEQLWRRVLMPEIRNARIVLTVIPILRERDLSAGLEEPDEAQPVPAVPGTGSAQALLRLISMLDQAASTEGVSANPLLAELMTTKALPITAAKLSDIARQGGILREGFVLNLAERAAQLREQAVEKLRAALQGKDPEASVAALGYGNLQRAREIWQSRHLTLDDYARLVHIPRLARHEKIQQTLRMVRRFDMEIPKEIRTSPDRDLSNFPELEQPSDRRAAERLAAIWDVLPPSLRSELEKPLTAGLEEPVAQALKAGQAVVVMDGQAPLLDGDPQVPAGLAAQRPALFEPGTLTIAVPRDAAGISTPRVIVDQVGVPRVPADARHIDVSGHQTQEGFLAAVQGLGVPLAPGDVVIFDADLVRPQEVRQWFPDGIIVLGVSDAVRPSVIAEETPLTLLIHAALALPDHVLYLTGLEEARYADRDVLLIAA